MRELKQWMGRKWRLGAIGAAVAVVATQCVYWDPWDNVFKRDRGWLMADGGYSIPLPPVGAPKGTPALAGPGGRHYFYFGDGSVWNPGFEQPWWHVYTDQELIDFDNAYPLFGNSAAIVTYASDPWLPGTVTFYARERNGNCEDNFSNCPVVDLDSDTLDPTKVIQAAGFQPRRLSTDPHRWPLSAVYVENPGLNLPPNYEAPSPIADPNEPFVAMGFQEVAGANRWGFNIATNITAPLPQWSYAAGTPMDPVVGTGTTEDNWGGTRTVDWGASLIHVAGDDKTLIFGRRLGYFGQVDAVLATAWPSPNLVDPQRWFYLYKAGTQGCPTSTPCWGFAPVSPAIVDDLHPVAEKTWNDFSVDYICHNEPAGLGGPAVNACAFVMVHGTFPDNVEPGGPVPALDPNCKAVTGPMPTPGFPPASGHSTVNARWGMVRTTTDVFHFPPARHGSEGAGSTFLADELINPGWDREILCDDPHAERRMVRQIRAQAGLREPGNIFVSWYVGVWQPEPTEHEHLWVNDDIKWELSRKGNLRFGKFPLSWVQPWCTATGTCP